VPVDLQEVIGNVVDDTALEAGVRSCEIVLRLVPVLQVQGSPELLHRAMENVLRNAIRYSPYKGVIDISARKDGGRMRIAVADRGPGVAPADLDAIFAHSGPRLEGEHLGLGLAIARRVLVVHGGLISAHNRDSGGLAVELELPSY